MIQDILTKGSMMKIAAILVAAGRGTSAGAGLPKQWRALAGQRVFDWTYQAFKSHRDIAHVIAVVHPDDHACLPAGL